MAMEMRVHIVAIVIRHAMLSFPFCGFALESGVHLISPFPGASPIPASCCGVLASIPL